jgi:SlyX protein
MLAKMKRQTELLAEKIKEAQTSPSMMSNMPEPPPPHY